MHDGKNLYYEKKLSGVKKSFASEAGQEIFYGFSFEKLKLL